MLITVPELVDLAIMSAVIGFIFADIFPEPASKKYDPLKEYLKRRGRFNLDNFRFAALVTAPAIILHEMSHKFVALAFGIQSTFHAAYTWLGIGLLLKLLSPGFIFFIPGYVSYPAGMATHLQQAIISFAGPGMNLALWLAAWYSWKRVRNHKLRTALYLTKQINMFLFIFNMLPIPPFDGGHFFFNTWVVVQSIF
jgi:Zn-dependent protease